MRSLFETPPEHPFCRFWSTFGVHLGTLWNHFFNTFFDLIFRPPFEPKNKSAWPNSGKIAEPPSPKPLTLFLLSKKQGRMQRPSQTQRVLALPVIRQPPGPARSFATPPPNLLPFSVNNGKATSSADSESPQRFPSTLLRLLSKKQ